MDEDVYRQRARTWHEIREDVDAEIAFHIEMRRRQLERRGLPPAQAEAEARAMFGDIETTRARCAALDELAQARMRRRDGWGEIVSDVRIALRQVWRHPGFAVASVLTLALGIGATVALSTVADHVLLRPLANLGADRIVTIWETEARADETHREVSPGNFLEWRARSAAFEAMGMLEPTGFDLAVEGRAWTVPGWLVSDGLMNAAGIEVLHGRAFVPDEFRSGSPRVVILSHEFWRGQLRSDESVIGRSIVLDGLETTVVGVLPPGLDYPEPRPIWAPKILGPKDANTRATPFVRVVARMREAVTEDQARADLARVATTLASEFPATNQGVGVRLIPLRDHVLGPVSSGLTLLLLAVSLALLIACANVAGLFLARGVERGPEIATRFALGARRGRVVRQLLTEAAVFAVFAGIAGIALAWAAIRALPSIAPGDLPRVETIVLDLRIVAYAVGITFATSLLSGLLPAVTLAGRGAGVLHRGRRGRPAVLRRSILGLEVALTMVLVAGAVITGRSFAALMANDIGFETADRLAVQVFLWDLNPTAEQRIQTTSSIMVRMRGVPGVEDVATVSSLPFQPTQPDVRSNLFLTDGNPDPIPVSTLVASHEYFNLMGMSLRRGRPFAEVDDRGSPQVAIVNETLARRAFPVGNAVGQRISVGVMGPPVTREIVGVVSDVRPTTFEGTPNSEVYVPFRQSGAGHLTFVVKVSKDANAALPAIRERIWEVDPAQPIYADGALSRFVGDEVAARRFPVLLLGALSALAVVLASVGIYGLTSFLVAQRRAEIGIRMALGARPGRVAALVLRDATAVVIPGLLVGAAMIVGAERLLAGRLYEFSPTDPVTYTIIAGAMLGLVLIGSWVPARRASAIQPGVALRN